MKQAVNEHIEIIAGLSKEFQKTGGSLLDVEKAIEWAFIIGKTSGFKMAIRRIQNKLSQAGVDIDIESLAYGISQGVGEEK